MTDYGNLKIDGRLHTVLKTTAKAQYDSKQSILTRPAAEGTILWLILYADQHARQAGLTAAGFDTVTELIRHVRQQQFPRDVEFQPLKPLRGNDMPDTLIPDGGGPTDRDDMIRATTDEQVGDVTHCEVCDHYVDTDPDSPLSHADDCPEGGDEQ